MSNSPSVSDNRSTSDPEEVIRLVCPDCDGKLNLRRKHIGIAGNCVHCRIPVMAVEEDGDVFLRLTQKVEENPRPTAPPAKSKPEAPDQPPAQSENTAESNAPSPPLPADGAAAASSVPQSPSPPDPSDPSEPSPPMPRSAEAETSSRWGFPDRETNHPIANQPPGAAGSTAEDASRVSLENTEVTTPFPDSTDQGDHEISAGVANARTEPETRVESGAAENSSSEIELEASSSSFVDSPSLPEASDDSLDLEAPVGKKEEEPFDFHSGDATSALFDTRDEEEEVHSGWGAGVPQQNHASLSPFSTGSASLDGESETELGFAETLFGNKPSESDPDSPARRTGAVETKATFGPTDEKKSDHASSPDGSASAFANIGKSPEESDEPVVLDGDGRPMAPMTDEEKDSFAREMMELGDYHARSPWVKRIRRFVLTVLILAGIGYGAYAFLPADLAKDYKNKTLAWLEPGSVLLDFLPFEIADDPEGEEGDKTVKIKAIEGLNQLNDQFDGYLNQADENLRETGAKVEEREKIEHMEGPNIPKLPFNLPGMDSVPERPEVEVPGGGE